MEPRTLRPAAGALRVRCLGRSDDAVFAVRRVASPVVIELSLVAHRALREVPRVAAVQEFLVQEAARVGLRSGDR